MKNNKKQTAAAAMATVLSVSTAINPVTVMALEDNPVSPAIIEQENGQLKTAPEIITPNNLQATAGTALKDVALPEHWTWADDSTLTTTETAEYPARFTVDDVTYDYSEVEGYNAENHYIEKMVTVTVKPAKQESAQPEQKLTRMLGGNMPTTYAEGDIEIDATKFPDEAFRTWLRQQTYGEDGTITQAEIADITTIKVTNKTNIKDLTGIEYFTALTALHCKGTGITSLDVSKNTALKELYCYSTEISSLDVSKNTSLTTLWCYSTGITSLDVSKNIALTSLYCDNTGITSLDVSKNTALKELYCYSTGISSLDVSKNTALAILQCYSTGITSLDVSKNTALTTLQCNGTGISSLDVSKNTALENLDCYSTGISSLDVSKNTALESLWCNNTGITNLDVSKNPNLESLCCASTGITNLDVSNNMALKELLCNSTGISSLDVSNNTALTSLYCSKTSLAYLNVGTNNNLTTVSKSNLKAVELEMTEDSFNMADKFTGIDKSKISSVSGATYNKDTGVMSNYKAGTPIGYTYDCGTSSGGTKQTIDVTLNLKGYVGSIEINEINFKDEAFRTWLRQQTYGQDGKITQAEIATIKSIDVSGYPNIKNLKGIEYFTSLTFLNCYDTGISSLDISKNTKLTVLYCYGTTITDLDVSKNIDLAKLNCSNTGINSLNISQNTKLTHLSCHNTKIESLNVSQNTILEELNCSDTLIEDLDVSKNTSLKVLGCFNTKIESLDVSENTALKELYCDNTGIKNLDVSTNMDLITLWCANTGIKCLDVSRNTKLTTLYCYSTPLAYLNIGTNDNLASVDKGNLKDVDLEISGDSFNIADKFTDIDKRKITITSGATYNKDTGVMSNYKAGTPIRYTYDCGTSSGGTKQLIDVTLNLTDIRADSTVSITANLNKTYDKTAVTATPAVNKSGSTGAVTYKWERKKNATEWEEIASAPKEAGIYRVTASVAADNNYKGATSTSEFTIAQAEPSYTVPKDLKATYGQTLADVTLPDGFSWSDATQAVGNAGTNTFTAVFTPKDTKNYKTMEDILIRVTVDKADNAQTAALSIAGWTYGSTPDIASVGFRYGKPRFLYSNRLNGIYTDTLPISAGTWYVKAVVDDTVNYEGAESEPVSFVIEPRSAVDTEGQIKVPEITAATSLDKLVLKDGDKVLVQGKDYVVTKVQNGDVVTVTITFKGNYSGVITKTAAVKGTEASLSEGKDDVATGDASVTGFWGLLTVCAAGLLGFLKKRMYRKGE